MRKVTLAAIPVDQPSHGDPDRRRLECYLSFQKRQNTSGFFISWLPIELTEMGGVSFCISNLVTTPVWCIEQQSRFSQKKLDKLAREIPASLHSANNDTYARFLDNYETIKASCCKDWKLPSFESALCHFARTEVTA
jgi:hypothetical protein